MTNVKDRNDVGMIQRGGGLGFLLKAMKTLGVARPILGEDLDGDFALQCSVAGTIDLAHSTCAEWAKNLVTIQSRTWGQCHR